MSRFVFTMFIAAATLLLGACSVFANTVVGTGHATTEQRTVDAFTKVRVDTAISTTVIVGPDVTVAVTADDNLQSSVSTSVIAGRLTISLKTGAQPRTPISVAVTVPNLEEADVGSAANLIATGINTSSFTAEADFGGHSGRSRQRRRRPCFREQRWIRRPRRRAGADRERVNRLRGAGDRERAAERRRVGGQRWGPARRGPAADGDGYDRQRRGRHPRLDRDQI